MALFKRLANIIKRLLKYWRALASLEAGYWSIESKGLVLQDYLSCEIKFSDDKKRVWLGQPHLIKNLENKFGGLVNHIKSDKTPDTPKFLIKKILIEYQREY